MLSLYRNIAAGFLIFGVVTLSLSPSSLNAQAKTDPKKDVKADPKKVEPKKTEPPKTTGKDDPRNFRQSFGTSDGLALSSYWFPADGTAPDTVMMFPAPGNKINDQWITLAKELNKKGFSILLFDWRGCGMNGTERGERIFEDKDAFQREAFNAKLLPKSTVNVGLDYARFNTRYRDFLMNDLTAARYDLDKKNDTGGKANTNRIWIVTEGAGAQMGLAFIASEAQRSSVYRKNLLGDLKAYTQPAVKDYAGIVALSFNQNSTTGRIIYNNALPSNNTTQLVADAKQHFENRLAMVMVYGKKESASISRSFLTRWAGSTATEEMKKKFKYLIEVDNSKAAKTLTGMDMIDASDSFGARAKVVEAMTEISKDKQDFGKTPTMRNLAENTTIPRFNIEMFKPN